MSTKTGQHPIAVVAEVQSMELNLDHSGAYKLRLADGSTIRADFTALQWGHFEGMHQQGRYPLKIVGIGEYADGRLQRIVSMDLPQTKRVLPPEDPEMPTIWHKIDQISKSVDWSDVPTDLATNMHHYLYGRTKVDE